jgi:hypothetical protein
MPVKVAPTRSAAVGRHVAGVGGYFRRSRFGRERAPDLGWLRLGWLRLALGRIDVLFRLDNAFIQSALSFFFLLLSSCYFFLSLFGLVF